jgi:predicted transposase/invertase (TIGR01784 family)
MNSNHPKNVHDAYFTWFTSNPGYSRQLLSCILPPALLELLDLSTLGIVSPNQTDSRLRRHQSDILFEIKSRTGQPFLIYLLLEHKSYHDTKASFQVLRYIIHIAEDWLRLNQPLRCIIPVVLYNGSEPWTTARSLHELFEIPQACASMFPQFRVSVLDLPRMEDKILHGPTDFLASARILRSGPQPDLAVKLPEIFTGLTDRLVEAINGCEAPDSPLPAILSYVASQVDPLELEQIIDQTFKDNPMIKAQMLKSAAEVRYEEGRLKGQEEGRQEGRQEGFLMAEIQFLERQLGRPVSSKAHLDELTFEDLTVIVRNLRSLAAQN